MKLARGFDLDPDYIGGGTVAILAKKGAGKSYTARVMGEEFWDAKVPFVLMDPMGTSWGLRSSADGEGEGIPVAIFGGKHGDAPLERGSGGLIADLVVDERLSMVLDMSELGSRAAERQFALEFFDRLYRRNKELVHLLVDEADLFAPQKPQHGDRPLLGMTENIVRRGRNKGIGITLITQRPAVLNKDVLTQVDALVAMRITGLTDRQAIDAWVSGHGDDPALAKEVKESLSHLAAGQCWWWVPELDILKKVQVRRSRTFDSSPTRKRGAAPKEPKGFADIDMAALEERMADSIERAKAEDPKELQKRVHELEVELAEAEHVGETETIEVPVPYIPEEVRAVLEAIDNDIVTNLRAAGQDQLKHAEQLGHDVAGALTAIKEFKPEEASRVQIVKREVAPPAEPPAPRARTGTFQHTGGNMEALGSLSTQASKLLEVMASRHPVTLTRSQLSLASGYSSRSSSWSRSIGELKDCRAIVEEGGQLEMTPAGFSVFGGEPPPPQSPQERRDMWRSSLKGPQAQAFFDALVAAHPGGLTREQMSDQTGYSKGSSSFSTTLTLLRNNKLVREESGELYAAEDLFS